MATVDAVIVYIDLLIHFCFWGYIYSKCTAVLGTVDSYYSYCKCQRRL